MTEKLLIQKTFVQNIHEFSRIYTYSTNNAKSNNQKIHLQRLVIGYSGGVDSTILLHYAQKYAKQHDLSIHALYTDHGDTFGTPTAIWQKHCQQHCHDVGIPFTTVQLQLETQGNKENRARLARYRAFRQFCQTGDLLLLGHHLDDSFENFLLRIQRGGGLHSLLTPHVRVLAYHPHLIYLLRPFWQIAKETLVAEAVRLGLRWVEDPSNQCSHLSQNHANDRAKLRSLVIPRLNKITKNWRGGWLACQRTLQAEQSALDYFLDRALLDMLSIKGICIATLITKPQHIQIQILHRWLTLCDCAFLGWKNLDHHLPRLLCPQKSLPTIPIKHIGNSAKHNIQLSSYAGYLWLYDIAQLSKIHNEIYNQYQPITTSNTWNTRSPWCAPCGRLNAEGNNTVHIRFHKNDAKVRLSGRVHHSKLRNIWQEIRLPVWERALTPHMYSDGLLIAIGDTYVCTTYNKLPLKWQPSWRIQPHNLSVL